MDMMQYRKSAYHAIPRIDDDSLIRIVPNGIDMIGKLL